MTEKQWLKCADPQAMLEHLGTRASDRKLRLFACACCRRAWHLVKSPKLKKALPLLEGFADGTVSDRDRGHAHKISGEVLESAHVSDLQPSLGGELWKASKKTLNRRDFEFYNFGESAAAAFGYAAGDPYSVWAAAKATERKEQAKLVREMFGNPFWRVSFSPAWRTDTAVSLAKQMYEAREFGAMPILADAIQDAGCDCDELLDHLRDTSATHVRGCWALDLVLGKE